MDKDAWVTAPAAARILGVSLSTFRRLVASDALASVRRYTPASRSYYSRPDLEQYKLSKGGDDGTTGS